MQVHNLVTEAKLAPFSAAPTFEHIVGVIPFVTFQADPRPLEVIPIQLWPEGPVQSALQLLQLPMVLLRFAPLAAGRNNSHVVEHAVCNPRQMSAVSLASASLMVSLCWITERHHDAEVGGIFAEPLQALVATSGNQKDTVPPRVLVSLLSCSAEAVNYF